MAGGHAGYCLTKKPTQSHQDKKIQISIIYLMHVEIKSRIS